MIVKSRYLMVALLLSVCGTIPAAEEPKPAVPVAGPAVGEAVPVFKATDDGGQAWDLAEHARKNYTVIYFYPADFTGGCGKQAESFRDSMNQFAELVYGPDVSRERTLIVARNFRIFPHKFR